MTLFTKLVKSKEDKSNRSKRNGKDADPHQNTGCALRVKIYEEVGVDQRCLRVGDQNRSIKLQDHCLNEQEDHVSERETDRGNGIIPLSLFALTEQEPVSDIENRKNHVEAKAADAPVCLGIAPLGTCKHNVKHKEGQQNAEHADEFEHGCNGDVAVLFLLCRLNQRRKHYTKAQKVTDIGEMYVEIPTDHLNVIKDTKACDNTHKSEGTIDSLENKLRCSVFNHGNTPLSFSIQYTEYGFYTSYLLMF